MPTTARSRACRCAEANHAVQLALFDFDHTLTDGDSYARFLRRVATPGQLRRARWRIGPWVLGYRAGLVSAAALRKRVTRLAFDGRDAEEIVQLGEAHARDTLPDMLRPEMMQRLRWHLDEGHEVVLVSASLDTYLQPWCEQHGLHGLICNRLASRDGRLTGTYADGDIGNRKAELIRTRHDLARYTRIHAYGDSREDHPMLALAHERWYRGKPVA